MWELDHKEGWAPKNWCFQIVVLEKTLRVPWIATRSNQSILKEINSEYSLESSNTLATWCEGLTLWKRSWFWEIWGQEEKGVTEHEMVGWHHQLNGPECEQSLGDSKGQETSHDAVHGFTKIQTWLTEWMTTTMRNSDLLKLNLDPWEVHLFLSTPKLGSQLNIGDFFFFWTRAHTPWQTPMPVFVHQPWEFVSST